jgi:hypothetical protein
MVADQEQRRTAKRTAGRESDSAPDVASRDSEAKNAAEPKPTAAAISAAFESFWAVYPKRVAKLAARRALAAAVKAGADPEAMIAGAARYAAERVGQEGRYTKHPATWINAGCWDDESPGGGVVLDGVTGEPVAVEPRVPARSAATGGVQDIAEERARFYEQRGRR